MAAPRVFVSSTFYDLKYIRASIEAFIKSLGFDSVLFEQGDIPYTPDEPLDVSAYREVQNCDIYVLIIGGRYGSEVSKTVLQPDSRLEQGTSKASLPDSKNYSVEAGKITDFYESITRREFETAIDKRIPTYVLIEKAVYAEYKLYLKNRDNVSIIYPSVDSINVFRFIEFILSQPFNNPTYGFDKFADIEVWLTSQWAGLFRELLARRSTQQQIATLAAQVSELSEINKTLRHYLESVLRYISPEQAVDVIRQEEHRLKETELHKKLKALGLIEYLMKRFSLDIDVISEALGSSSTPEEFVQGLDGSSSSIGERLLSAFARSATAQNDINIARQLLGKDPFSFSTFPQYDVEQIVRRDARQSEDDIPLEIPQ